MATVDYSEILRQHELGISAAQIAKICNNSRHTVDTAVMLANCKNISYADSLTMSHDELANNLSLSSKKTASIYTMPDYEQVTADFKNGVTLEMLWNEYKKDCESKGLVYYQRTQFKKYFYDHLQATGATMVLSHKPGQDMQVDWAGDTIRFIDGGGEKTAYLFVAVLPYSNYCYTEAFASMQESDWITANVHALEFFHGAPKCIICDNLKTGVVKHTRNEIILNNAYQEFAAYYHTVIVPCRVRKPKDKAAVEGAVGNVSDFILKGIRNEQFLSLGDLNGAIADRLKIFNEKPFQKRAGSRASCFEEEHQYLQKLQQPPYEYAEWKVCKVAPNYHIQVMKMQYSVPYQYIGKQVQVRMTQNTVAVFFDGKCLCRHNRLWGRDYQIHTLEEHMPPQHKAVGYWNRDTFVAKAAVIGPSTARVMTGILDSRKLEQQAYKSCFGLLGLQKKYPNAQIENACTIALSKVSQPTLKNVRAILDTVCSKGAKDSVTEPSSSSYGFTRGNDYYGIADSKTDQKG